MDLQVVGKIPIISLYLFTVHDVCATFFVWNTILIFHLFVVQVSHLGSKHRQKLDDIMTFIKVSKATEMLLKVI